MTDFLLELRSEEIPARMQAKAKEDLVRLFAEEIARAGLKAQSVEAFATPRRLALIARGLPTETQSVSEERKGPRMGAPEAALAGFLRSTGLTRDQLTERDGVLFAIINKPGRPTADVLADAIPAIVRAFPWPKSMRWGAASLSTESLRWVRPLQGIVALFGEMIVPFAIAGVESGATTLGHRFHHAGPITIGSADDYVEKLRMCHVIVQFSERAAIIRDGAVAAAAAAGLTLVPDEGLVAENAGLTEWPVPLLGRFDAAFLDVPREVIQLTMRTNQKYFACTDAAGKLANAFVCTANIDAVDGGAGIVAGNEKVLAARLGDAKFFWESDLKVSLEDQAKKLSQIVFHEKLGTVADKVERVAKLARWLVEEGIVKSSPEGEGLALADFAETAAHLCKADLVTGMVGEFPELQGVMGSYYARAQGLGDEIADAIRDHYKPVGQDDEVPIAPVTVAVSLADKLDTVACFFAVDEKPTGSRDPYALRRAAISIVSIVVGSELRLPTIAAVSFVLALLIGRLVGEADRSNFDAGIGALGETGLMFDEEATAKLQSNVIKRRMEEAPDWYDRVIEPCQAEVLAFLTDRLKVQQREAGVRHDLIDAVFALGGEDDLVRLLARVTALQAFVGTTDGANLLAGYKRAANILKQSSPERGGGARSVTEGVPNTHQNPPLQTPSAARGSPPRSGEELALQFALDTAEPLAAAAIEREDFASAMTALASLRAPIDAFFEGVMVNDPDPAVRALRLELLARFRDAVHKVADFSKIEG